MAIGEIMTFAEAEKRHPDEWVLLEVTDDHNDHAKAKGRLLGHSANRRDLDAPFERFRADNPNALVAEFWTGDLVTGDAVIIL